MDYPTSLHFAPGSKITLLDDVKIDRASNGSARGRALYTVQKRRFELSHAYLTPALRDELRAFYDANRTLTFTLNWFEDTGVPQTSTVMFAGPIKWDSKSGVWWFATLALEEV